MLCLDGQLVSKVRRGALKQRVEDFKKRCGRLPGLAVVLVGSHPASQIYVRNKIKACAEVGIQSILRQLPPSTSQTDLENEILRLNEDASVDGILVQLPL